MKKLIIVIILCSFSTILFSCVTTCTCIGSNNTVIEIEIDPSESCSSKSGPVLGECS
ncbi:MAG: hypothetical protein LBI45_02815 [Bacteroidales bacterium]|nr:hypothetical protein [Bacteroidales bacterium]